MGAGDRSPAWADGRGRTSPPTSPATPTSTAHTRTPTTFRALRHRRRRAAGRPARRAARAGRVPAGHRGPGRRDRPVLGTHPRPERRRERSRTSTDWPRPRCCSATDDDTIGFHDLAHEYLLLHADALPALHEQLLDAYRGLLDEPDQWWQLPLDEPYIWEHLIAHLAGAGDRDTLVATVTDPAYQARRITRDGPARRRGRPGHWPREFLPDDRVVAWWRAGWPGTPTCSSARRHQAAAGARVAATMLAWLDADPSPAPARCTRPPGTAAAAALSRGARRARRRVDRADPRTHRPHRRGAGGGLVPRRHLAGHRRRRPHGADLGPHHRRHPSTLTGHTNSVHAVAWSPDGTRLATAGDDRTVRIWDPTTGETLTTLTGHTGAVRAVAWSPDGTRLATASDDDTVRIWDPATGQTTRHPHRPHQRGAGGGLVPRRHPPGHRQRRRHRAALGPRHRPDRSPPSPATPARCPRWPGPPTAPAWPPPATTGRCGSGTPPPASITATLTGHTGWVCAVAWSPDGTRLATAGDDGTVRIWDPTTGHTLTAGSPATST